MLASRCCRGRVSRRSHEVDALTAFLLLRAAAGLLLFPPPSQLSSPSPTTRVQHKRSSHQHGPPSQCAGGRWCLSPMWFVSRGHDGCVHAALESEPWPCSGSFPLTWAPRKRAPSGIPATSPSTRFKLLPLTMSTTISTRGRRTGAGITRFSAVGDRPATALEANGQETSVTTSITTTTPDAAVELDKDEASSGTDGGDNSARGSIGMDGDRGSQGEGSWETGGRGGTWGARLRRGLRRKADGETESTGSDEMEAIGRKGIFTYDWENGPRVKWVASKRGRAIVKEGPRKLSDYLALPPTEYSVLDPKMITRLTDDTFKMDGGTLNILGTKVNPLVFMRADVLPEGNQANIVVERVELDGSEAVRAAGGTFNVTSTTVVTSAEVDDGNPKTRELQTRADIEIELLVPNENFVPLGVLSRTGSFIMQRVVDIGLPQFTRFLKKDYAKWSQGDDSRSAVASEDESLIMEPLSDA